MPAKKNEPATPVEETPAAIAEEAQAPIVETAIEPAPAPVAEAWDSPEVQDVQTHWPSSEGTRKLSVPLTEEEYAEAGKKLADTIRNIRILEEEKKGVVDRIKSQITDEEARQDKLTVIIDRGTHEKDVPVIWLFGLRGRDDDGRFIRDDNYKTLVRKDTGAVVEVAAVTDNDRQLALPMPEETPPEEALADEAEAPVSATDGGEEYNAAYNEGSDAFRTKVPRHNCPHPAGSVQRQGWRAGWDDAAEEGGAE